jgi:hypothetical protein
VYRPADASAIYYRGKAVAAYSLEKSSSAVVPTAPVVLIALVLAAVAGIGVWDFRRPRRETGEAPALPDPRQEMLPLGGDGRNPHKVSGQGRRRTLCRRPLPFRTIKPARHTRLGIG